MRYLALLFLPLFLFSFEVNFSKKFSKSLNEDTLVTYFSIVVNKDSEEEINKALSRFDKKIKRFDKVEKSNGTLTIRPQYRTSNNAPKITGYTGELRYKISSNKASNLNEFLDEMINLKEHRSTNIVINNLRWTVKDEIYEKENDNLRLEAIKWASLHAKFLSKELKQKCELKDISINNSNYRTSSKMVYSNAQISDSKLSVPQSNKEEISINPTFTMECK